jgi:hypothetical protein
VSVVLAGVVFLTGCGGGGGGTTVSMAASQRPDVDQARVQQGKLALPSDAAFNYTKFTSGQEGRSARGEAEAVANNGARCRAEVSDEGSAWGGFQYGYCFDNATGKALNAVVSLSLNVDRSASRSEGAASAGEAVGGNCSLIFFIKDSYGLTLLQESLVTSALGKGAKDATLKITPQFDVKMEPERGYYLILAGRADAKAPASQAAAVSLKASDVSIEIAWTPALAGSAETQEPATDDGVEATRSAALSNEP